MGVFLGSHAYFFPCPNPSASRDCRFWDRLYNSATGITVDNPFGASTNKVIFGRGGNVNISSLGAGIERTLANNVDFVTNRLIINNNLLGTGLPLLPLNITGDVLLKLAAPGDLYLRQNLKISGIVSGTGPTAGIFFAGNAGTLTLSNVANTFTNNIRFANSSILQVPADGSMGDAANVFQFNGGTFSASGNLSVGLGAGTGTLTLDSGTLNNGLEFIVGWTGDGVFNVNDGLANLNNLSLTNAEPFTATINFNGSLIQAKNNRADFIETNTTTATTAITAITAITANVQAGGAKFDTNNFAITINQPLIHDAALSATLDGGLTKSNQGTLTLTAANTYTGPTTVEGGSLLIDGDHTAATGATTVNPSAGLGGVGTINGATYADKARFPWTVADWTAAPSLSAGAVTIDGALTVVVGENALANFTEANATFTILSASSLTVTSPGQLTVDASAFTSGTGSWAVQQDGNTLELVYTIAAPGGYTAWAATNAGGQTADLDFDNDGVSNGVEYFMGETGSTFTANPGVIAGKVIWPKDPTFSGTFKVQVSETLALGSWTDIVPPDASIDETNPNQVVYTLPTGDPKKFARLNVTVTP